MEDEREWYRRQTISSWRRVVAAVAACYGGFAATGLAHNTEFYSIVQILCTPVIFLSFLFVGASLSVTLMYKLSGGFNRSSWVFGESNLMRIFIIREVI